jgi:membrane associated rhomboid family serine protease
LLDNLAPVSRALLFANIAAFLAQQAFYRPMLGLFGLWPGGELFAPWQLITYAFLHGSFAHLAFNMLGLLVFGNDLERLWGARRFVQFYFASVVAAAMTQLLVAQGMDQYVPTVGASGGIYGLLLGFAVVFPERRIVPLIPPIPMPARVYALVFAGLELLLGVTGTASGVAHFAHLGGMIGGALMLLLWRRGARRPTR